MLLYAFCFARRPYNADHDGQIVGFLAAGLTYSTSIVNDLVYSPEGDKEAAAAGFILLSMVMVSHLIPYLLTATDPPDCMDLLLRLNPSSHPPRLH